MVEITEESSHPYDTSASSDGASSSRQQQPTSVPTSAPGASANGVVSATEFLNSRMMDCFLAFARVLTLVFAAGYVLPFLSLVQPESGYYKALAAAAATNALRMQQRVGAVSLSREFLGRLMLEDSCHYLFYCVLFLTNPPLTMALLPVALYAALHAANFAVVFLTATGKGEGALAGKLRTVTSQHTQNLLGVVACSEIFLCPLLVSHIFVGKGSLFTPFVYYRFLSLRYASRRNPYTRQAFSQMRFSLDQVSASASCPAIVRQLIQRSIAVISNLAPAY